MNMEDEMGDDETRDPIMWVLITGEPFLTRAKEYRAERVRVSEALSAFLRDVGAENISHGFGALKFAHGKTPPGFKKPNRHGFAAPRKENTEWLAKLGALPKPPRGWDVVLETEVPFQIVHQDRDNPENRRGAASIGFFWDGAKIGWAGDQYFAVIPDPNVAAARHLRDYPNDVITNGCDTWILPAGLERATEARIDLLVAQERVRAEEYANAA